MVSFCLPWAFKPGSVGRPLPNVELRMVNEAETPMGPNQDGELWIRGRNVMIGVALFGCGSAALGSMS